MGVQNLSLEGWRAMASVGGTLLEIERDRADAAERELAEIKPRLADFEVSNKARGKAILEERAKVARLEAEIEKLWGKLNAKAAAAEAPEFEPAPAQPEPAQPVADAKPTKLLEPKPIPRHIKTMGKLLSRVLTDKGEDDGASNEADNAVGLLKEIAAKHGMVEPERIFYLEPNANDPLLFVVKHRDEEIAKLKERLEVARVEIERVTRKAASASEPRKADVSDQPARELNPALSGLYGALSGEWRKVSDMLPIARVAGFTGSPQTIYYRLLKLAKQGLIMQRGSAEDRDLEWKLKENAAPEPHEVMI